MRFSLVWIQHEQKQIYQHTDVLRVFGQLAYASCFLPSRKSHSRCRVGFFCRRTQWLPLGIYLCCLAIY